MIRSMRFRDLFCAIGVLLAPALSGAPAITAYSGPLFDAHCHVVQPTEGRGRGQPAILPPALFNRLRATGVTGVFFFAPANVAARVKRVGGDFVAPFASVAVDPLKQELHLSATTAAAVEEQLKAGMKGTYYACVRRREDMTVADIRRIPACSRKGSRQS
jgi:hypothetical protein